jgi:SAM-dependent methyltransferase
MPTDAEFWDSLFAKGQKFRPIKEEELDAILAHLGQPHDAADIGAGTGGLVLSLAARGIRATAFDISNTALVALREAADNQGRNELVRTVQADINNAAFGVGYESAFDVVFSKLSIAFARDRAGVLARTSAMLRPDGALVVITPVLLEGQTYDDRQNRISVPRVEFEAQLHACFGSVEVFHEDAPQAGWPVVTYICRGRRS